MSSSDATSQPPSPVTVFVSGHLDLTKEEFAEHYEPRILAALRSGCRFVVGDAPGCDFMAQRFIYEHWDPTCGRARKDLCTVYHMLHRPRHSYGSGWGSNDPNLPKESWSGPRGGFPLVGGFASDSDRDSAMTAASDEDIAWVRPSGSRKHSSGTAQNLNRRHVVVRERRLATRRALPRFYVNENEMYPVYSVQEVGDDFPAHRTVPVPAELIAAERRAYSQWMECQRRIAHYVNEERDEPTVERPPPVQPPAAGE